MSIGGHMHNQAEGERQALEKMGPSSNHPHSTILSLAARSVMSKKDRYHMQEETKMLEKYYADELNRLKKYLLYSDFQIA